MENRLVICDLDGTLIRFDSTTRLTRNNKNKLEFKSKYVEPVNLLFLAIDWIRSKIGLPVKNNIFFKNETKRTIINLISAEFSDPISFNTEVLLRISQYQAIILLTGSHNQIAQKILAHLPQEIRLKSEIIATTNEEINGVFTGKVLNHTYGFNKKTFLKKRFGKMVFDGIGNSIYDIPFLMLCKKRYLVSPSIILTIFIHLLPGKFIILRQ